MKKRPRDCGGAGCFGSREFRRRRLEELEQVAGDSVGGGLRQEVAINKADRIVAEELKRLRWTEEDLRQRRKSTGVGPH
jgi:hypothetical protein